MKQNFINRLKDNDTEIAEQFEQIIRRQKSLRPTEHENLREKSPQEDWMKVSLMTLVTLCLFMVVSCIKVVPPRKYEGPQTVEALLETFGEKVGTNPEIDEK